MSLAPRKPPSCLQEPLLPTPWITANLTPNSTGYLVVPVCESYNRGSSVFSFFPSLRFVPFLHIAVCSCTLSFLFNEKGSRDHSAAMVRLWGRGEAPKCSFLLGRNLGMEWPGHPVHACSALVQCPGGTLCTPRGCLESEIH